MNIFWAPTPTGQISVSSQPMVEGNVMSQQAHVSEYDYNRLMSGDYEVTGLDDLGNPVVQRTQASLDAAVRKEQDILNKQKLQAIKDRIKNGTQTPDDILQAIKLMI